jgi:hypothetical protein
MGKDNHLFLIVDAFVHYFLKGHKNFPNTFPSGFIALVVNLYCSTFIFPEEKK